MRPISRRDMIRTMMGATGLVAVDSALGAPMSPPACLPGADDLPKTHVIVLCDRTFNPDGETRRWLDRAVAALVATEGALIQVGGFSAAGGRDGAAVGEPFVRPRPLDEERLRSLRRSQVARIRNCHRAQLENRAAQVGHSVQSTLGSEVATATSSDIAASLSIVVHPFRITGAPRRLLLVISDGIEHHAEQSFYRDQKPRLIVPTQELEILLKRDIPGDLTEVEVLWAGLGYAQTGVDWTIFRPLQRYWTEVIRLQGGQPVELATTPTTSVAQLLQRPRSAPSHLATQQRGTNQARGAVR